MKKFVYVMMIVLLLVSGCAKDEEKKAVCRITQDGISDELTLNALNDQVLTTTSIMKLPFSMYDLTTDDEKAQFVEQLMAGFGEYEGIEVDSETTEEEFVLKMSIDYSIVKLEDLVTLGLIAQSDVDSEMISFEKTVESLTASGYTCE